MLRHSTMDTPAGPFTLVVGDSGAVRAAGFTTDVPELIRLIHPSLAEPAEPADDVGPAQAAVRAYFQGDLTALDSIAVEQRTGGEFMAHAWLVMREIKPGDPVTYSRYAELAGRPAAIRAAAAACARNPVALIVPCHRVFRTDGGLGGYRWGLPVKSWLLEHESAG
ncbi:methylated-DNA--[protein]-cysteine S-methyltransferase [Actinoplanes palleronii]|uniref:Methylated-DNA:protein-cysteine methyltransferase n=1 Tax=Actinoplanes palleronii TaxID=113570 RepID=A0ABQ4B3D9_9ACTN|nr:methylated-DNA--[protein]-cysteine S-methyltransferase [Actinoplanes palleronii]GIE65188.1 putative methylated-DNA:protein-cysteine methyltransferase [Actinoplanes palleronii]